jgi:hypothetical protein
VAFEGFPIRSCSQLQQPRLTIPVWVNNWHKNKIDRKVSGLKKESWGDSMYNQTFCRDSLLAFGLLLLVGCATTDQLLPENYFDNTDSTVAIGIATLPTPDLIESGQQGLLDIAVNRIANSGLREHLATIPIDDFSLTMKNLKSELEQHGFNVLLIDEPIAYMDLPLNEHRPKGFERRDVSSLTESVDADQLLLLIVNFAGAMRNYHGFVPTSAPKGYSRCEGRLIELDSNQLLWHVQHTAESDVISPWNQSEISYPNLTNSVLSSLTSCGDHLLSRFVTEDELAEEEPTALAAQGASNSSN